MKKCNNSKIKKLFVLPFIAAVAIATVVGKKTFGSESKDLLMQNVEALTDSNESEEESTCEGWLGNEIDKSKTIKGCLQKHGSFIEPASAIQLPFQSHAGCGR